MTETNRFSDRESLIDGGTTRAAMSLWGEVA